MVLKKGRQAKGRRDGRLPWSWSAKEIIDIKPSLIVFLNPVYISKTIFCA